ncbi:hypothetical protein ABBQ38_007487 [Trebouxia sp. C0009 RCD-2024]
MEVPSKRVCRRLACTWPDCSYTTLTRQHLQQHTDTVHLSKRPYQCTIDGCDSAFGAKVSLQRHISSVHHKLKQYKCTYSDCDARFANSAGLGYHVTSVHLRTKHFRCAELGCTASFVKLQSLQKHTLGVHQKQKAYPCSFCDKRLASQQSLDNHVKVVHKGDREFTCKESGCEASYGTKSGLDSHVKRVHLGHNPFVCPTCSTKFDSNANLTIHVQAVHLRNKPHVCDFTACSEAFARRHDLVQHIKSFHSEEGQQRQRKEEQKVVKALQDAGIDFKREHHVKFDCWDDTFARLDFLMLRPRCCILLEVDEGEHEWYGVECEVSRMTKVHAEGNTLPLLFIRYNPHSFRVDGELCTVRTRDRLARLVEFVQDWECSVDKALEVQYMFYSCEHLEGDLSLNIWSDIAYNSEVRACCREPIV